MFSTKEVDNFKRKIYPTKTKTYSTKFSWKRSVKKGLHPMSPLFCYTYNEFKKKSGLDNKEASSIWMDFKFKQFIQ